MPIGDSIRYFGDGWQVSKKFGDRHFWRVPVMDGEFLCEATTGLTKKAVGGGNLLIMGANPETTMRAAELAVDAMNDVEGVILPFPGGIVRSGSKVGSKYKAMMASTNDAYCPTLRGAVATRSRRGYRLRARNRHRRIDGRAPSPRRCGRASRRS